MSEREVRRFVDDVVQGRRARPFHPDEEEAAEMRAAIELRAARPGADAPREEFLADLHRRLAAEMTETEPDPVVRPLLPSTRRQVIAGASIAAAAAVIGAVVDRSLIGGGAVPPTGTTAQSTLTPAAGQWRPVAASADLPDGGVQGFDLGVVTGFVHRANGQLQAVSGVCTHQGCRLWLDAPAEQLRCPCHVTSFAVTGEVVTHQLPIAPAPLPHLQVRETGGTIEVYAPTEPA